MTTPSSREVLDRILADQRGEIHTSFPGKVIAYDVEAQTVDVRPALLREIGSDETSVPWGFEQLPDILSVQVMWPRAGGFAITFPIEVGDWVLVLCAEQSTLLWRSKGTAPTHPGLVDPHGLNGCVALPGWYPDVEKLRGVSTTDLVIGNPTTDATVRISRWVGRARARAWRGRTRLRQRGHGGVDAVVVALDAVAVTKPQAAAIATALAHEADDRHQR